MLARTRNSAIVVFNRPDTPDSKPGEIWLQPRNGMSSGIDWDDRARFLMRLHSRAHRESQNKE